MKPKSTARFLALLGAVALIPACGSEDDHATAAPGGVAAYSLGATGGVINLGFLRLTAPDDSVARALNVVITTGGTLPAPLPAAFMAAGKPVSIDVSDASRMNGPFIVELTYDPAGLPDEEVMTVLHYDAVKGYRPTTVLSHDAAANTITFHSRVFSPFVVVRVDMTQVPTAHTVTGFAPATDGWDVGVSGGYYAPGGESLGMAGFSAWFHGGRPAEDLSGRWPSAGASTVGRRVAARTHLAQLPLWAGLATTFAQTLTERQLGELTRAHLSLFDAPLVLTLRSSGGPDLLAGVVFGYDDTQFFFYDTTLPGATQAVSYTAAAGFGAHGAFDLIGYLSLLSLGADSDFEALTTQADAGFSESTNLNLTSPTDGEVIAARQATVSGTLSGALLGQTSVVIYAKGHRQTATAAAGTGAFSSVIPVSNGTNTVIVLAGAGVANQNNWHAGAATRLVDITSTLPLSDFLATLTWDQEGPDVDLYVTEPNGETAWYADATTSNGLSLDFDNTTGYGPEHVTLSAAAGGTVLAGNYIVRVHYWTNHGTVPEASGRVTILIGEGTTSQRVASAPFTLASSNPNNDAPGATGSDWVNVAVVNLIAGTIQGP